MVLFLLLFTEVANIKIMKIVADSTNYPRLTIFVSALNQSGLPVTSFSNSDFLISEDNGERGSYPDSVKPLAVDCPTLLLFLIDVSKNMKDADLATTQICLWRFCTQRSGKENLAIMLFADTLIPLFQAHEQIDTLAGLLRFKQVRKKLRDRNARIADAIVYSMGMLKDKLGEYPFSAIVVFSKGIDNSHRFSIKEINFSSIKCQIPVFTIGINDSSTLLKQIADSTGGEYLSGANARMVEEAFRKLKFRLVQSMQLFYRTNIPGDSLPHKIKVKVGDAMGARLFVPPYKPEKLDFLLFLFGGAGVLCVLYLLTYLGRRKRRYRKKRPEMELMESQEEQCSSPSAPEPGEVKEPDAGAVVKEKKEETRTMIFEQSLDIAVKNYNTKEIFYYKKEEMETDNVISLKVNSTITVGSDMVNDLVLKGISPRHFSLRWEYKRLIINAFEETIVNGEALKGKKVFEEEGKYVINIGPYVLVLRL